MIKMFDCKGTDSVLTKYDGCMCEVIRELTKDEADIDEVGRMFHIKFTDGYETDAFEDELQQKPYMIGGTEYAGLYCVRKQS